jgi:serine/threonine protein kinase/Tol biopolymer transport system component
MAVKCPKCQFDNTDTARFCSNCATKLTPGGQPPAALTKTLESPAYILSKGSLIAGKYRILEEIGRGGMGVVYEAEDTKLARKVAVKVLPEIFTADQERLARFEREARVLASLNHPNVASIYGVEEAEGRRFLVLEFVEGETLAERLVRGPLPLEEALDVCSQIAEGLEGAHEKNIIHRDLKPSNVKITPEGKVKILDFGLARAFHDQISEVDIIKSPTITADMTQPGVILGTAAYMSPEQAKGKLVDKRADIWAFGCILYECLTGKLAFAGDTITETLAAILKGEPNWQSLPADIPWRVNDLLRRCLQKETRERLHDIADARLEIVAPVAFPSEPVIVRRRISLVSLAAYTIVMLLVGILIDRVFIKHPQPSLSLPVVTSTIKVEPGYSLDGLRRSYNARLLWPTRTAMAISSDGRFIVYCAVKDSVSPTPRPQLFLRRLGEMEAKPIPGTEGGISPVLSSDDKWIYFYADQNLRKIPVAGGVPQDLCEVISEPVGISCGSDGMIYFARFEGKGLFRVPTNGGTPEEFTRPDNKRKEFDHRLPYALPFEKGVLFTITAHAFDPQASIAFLDTSTRTWKVLFENGSDARYVPTGHLVFLRQGKLMAIPFDLDKLEARGQPVPVIDGVMHALNSRVNDTNSGAGQFSFSSSGSMVYAPGGIFPANNNQAFWVDRNGHAELIKSLTGDTTSARISPDGNRITYVSQNQIWTYDIERQISERLTSGSISASPSHPVWTPDGRRLIFAFREFGPGNLFWMPVDSSASMEKLWSSEWGAWSGSCSPDGNSFAFLEETSDNNLNIMLLNLKDRKAVPFAATSTNGWHAEFSLDGKWLAYTSDELGTDEVFVKALSGGRSVRISPDGGDGPLWGKSGKRIYFQKGDRMFVADILRTEPDFAVSKPRQLFELPGFFRTAPFRSYDLTRDEQRFLMFKREEKEPQVTTEMVLVQNWFDELKRLVHTGNN